jgi:hypothetical protein
MKQPIVLLFVFWSNAVFSQSVTQPDIKIGDTWIYDIDVSSSAGKTHSITREDHVIRAGNSDIVLSYVPDGGKSGSGAMLLEKDWSTRRRFNGVDEVFTKRFSFPMSPGKTWEIQLQLPYDRTHHRYEVVGWEKVAVPAGIFDALRIEDRGQGVWQHELFPIPVLPMLSKSAETKYRDSSVSNIDPATNFTQGGRIYSSYWYVPSIKREVKSIEEEYDENNEIEGRITFELRSYDVH